MTQTQYNELVAALEGMEAAYNQLLDRVQDLSREHERVLMDISYESAPVADKFLAQLQGEKLFSQPLREQQESFLKPYPSSQDEQSILTNRISVLETERDLKALRILFCRQLMKAKNAAYSYG
ncbi:MAG: hypothetical protein F6J86_20595 [Symploca sp. SIO1B1]|nr:hypothetical protein [Symploca sp. SIO1C2]NER47455.1 hypothetical protein [Symploca sp. SIO1A3]NER96209.1 hypothetical protein [Symploca sp. SIO1B1]